VGEFIYLEDFVVLETKRVANVANHICIILEHPFLATSNTLTNYINGMMKLYFVNMTLELDIFNLQRQLSRFDVKTSILNWVEDSTFHDEFGDMFVVEYESFLINDKPKNDVFQFDALCSASKCLIASTFEFDCSSTELGKRVGGSFCIETQAN